MEEIWVESQKEKVINIFKSHDFDNEFDLNDPFCCWLLIVLRMKYCFEMCDEFNSEYEKYHETGFYEILNDTIEENKKEAFYLFEKWFFNLWW